MWNNLSHVEKLNLLAENRLWRNFQGYTILKASDLIGLGVTAISDVAGSFAQNSSDLESYLKHTMTSGWSTFRGLATTPEDRLRRHVITQLMCNLRLDIRDVEQKFRIDFWKHF